ncbi:hypothetical protein GCM10010302_52520 [Streptomyces polychromogenes]|uniref:Uncharacterized protein n=1 Tax=Streptomyces polychromogenes TaxID=67342 RepID=A0ABP3F6B7_9ACTN
MPVLHGQRVVEAVALAERFDDGRVTGLVTTERTHRVAGEHEKTAEENNRRTEENDDHLSEPPDHISSHDASFTYRAWGLAASSDREIGRIRARIDETEGCARDWAKAVGTEV